MVRQRIRRLCAICEVPIERKERICAECKEKWAPEGEFEPWLVALIEETNKEYNYQHRHNSKTIPLDWVKDKV